MWLFFHLSIVLYFEKNASVDNQCFGFQLLLTNHPKHSGLKCLYLFLSILQSDGAQHLAGVACWCLSCWSAGWLRRWVAGPLSVHAVLGSHSPHVSPCGLDSSELHGSSELPRMSGSSGQAFLRLNRRLSSITSIALC